ncbi:MAG: hypothetical protein Q4G68_09435 [Planctomycetia bacterium]|nr:hypothetical protein [Planctomycetia bacterium]
MPHPQFKRNEIHVKPLAERVNKLDIVRDVIDAESYSGTLSPEAEEDVARAAAELRRARDCGAARILAFGAHSIKNGLGLTLAALAEEGWITHLATNGAGIIHDWEFAFQGKSGEDVHRYTTEGQFGIWNETGTCLNLALIVGAWRGLGYGESVGTMAQNEELVIPSDTELLAAIEKSGLPAATPEQLDRAAAASDLLAAKRRFNYPQEEYILKIPHPWKKYSLAFRMVAANIPFTCHPMFGHDIIYTHPMNCGAAIGRTAQIDFLSYANSVSQLQGGVYLSVGSAVMSPMIFEKSLSMSRNLALHDGKNITDFTIHVVDLAQSTWDWTKEGEPPMDNPAYYLRFCKTFSRMGGQMSYTSADNRTWLVHLLRTLRSE